MESQVDVESIFAEFVRDFGGEVLEDALPRSPNFKNADYLFRDDQIVAELKRLSDDKSSDQNIQNKIQKLFDGLDGSGDCCRVWNHDYSVKYLAPGVPAATY